MITDKRIIYPNDEGGVCVVVPAPTDDPDFTIEILASKVVPEGKPFKIINVEDVPSDRTFRNAWEYQE